MKIFHASDIHYCGEHLTEVDRCFNAAIDAAVERDCACAVLSGDLFDRRLELHAPAVLAALTAVRRLADCMPVLILQGTFSHDAPGSLDAFRLLASDYPVHVADAIQQVALLHGAEWCASTGWRFEETPEHCAALFSCLPAVNKATLAGAVGCAGAAEAIGDHVAQLLAGWAPSSLAARGTGIPSIVVSHGTVSGCLTEHGVPMAGLDHEYTAGTLFAAEASAVMLGHIHKHQAWERDGRRIAYPGSVGRLHFGELDPKGVLVWSVEAARASFEFIETPARRLLQIDCNGAPDLAELAALAEQAAGAHVRIRYQIDEEHRHSVDKAALAALFAAAEAVKIEGRINPVQRTRAAGIGRTPSLTDKLVQWAAVVGVDAAPLVDRLALLQAHDPEAIAEQVAAAPGREHAPATLSEAA